MAPSGGYRAGRTGQEGGKGGDRRAVQPVGDLQVTGPQIQGLVLEGGVGPHQVQGGGGLDGEHGQERPWSACDPRALHTPEQTSQGSATASLNR